MPLPARPRLLGNSRPYPPEKDVDCFHPYNQGLILQNRAVIFPCTPCGVMKILDHYRLDPAGLNAVVVGRSFLVGKPMAAMLANRNATVTLCHSRTVGLDSHPARGRPGGGRDRQARFHQRRHGQAGSDPDRRGHQPHRQGKRISIISAPARNIEVVQEKRLSLTGDIHFQAYAKAAHYTPVPGGVGPLTVTMLMSNTVELCKRAISVKASDESRDRVREEKVRQKGLRRWPAVLSTLLSLRHWCLLSLIFPGATHA